MNIFAMFSKWYFQPYGISKSYENKFTKFLKTNYVSVTDLPCCEKQISLMSLTYSYLNSLKIKLKICNSAGFLKLSLYNKVQTLFSNKKDLVYDKPVEIFVLFQERNFAFKEACLYQYWIRVSNPEVTFFTASCALKM